MKMGWTEMSSPFLFVSKLFSANFIRPAAFFRKASRPNLEVVVCFNSSMRTLHSLDYSEANRAVDLIVETTLHKQKAVSIAAADAHGDLICFARMDGAPVSSIRIAMNKAYTAARERKPTKEIGEKVRHPEKGHDIAYYGDANYVGWGGGVPVWKNGEVVGAIAVSGLTSAEDGELATIGVESISG
jgi:glc operon protein GlcG